MNLNDGRVVSNFIVNALKGKNISIYGNGTQTRSFCYVDDLINGIILMMESPDDFIGPVNLGNPVESSIIELAEKIIDLINSKSKIVYKDLPINDPKIRQPDIRKAKRLLGYNPKFYLEEGIRKFFEWYKNTYT